MVKHLAYYCDRYYNYGMCLASLLLAIDATINVPANLKLPGFGVSVVVGLTLL